MTRVLGLIPARGGSKRVDRKNLREVAGKPLIAHAIDHGNDASTIDKVVVSTDDEEIRQTANEYGGSAPFKRPADLATDEAGTAPVVTHALKWLENNGETFDIICLIQTTSPLRTAVDIDSAVDRLIETDSESVVSVSEFLTPPQWAVTEDDNGSLTSYFEQGELWGDHKRTQEIPSIVHPNGAVYASWTDSWMKNETFYTESTVGYKMPAERSLDIDEPWELELVRDFMQD